jgi:hypothetical protein
MDKMEKILINLLGATLIVVAVVTILCMVGLILKDIGII